MEVIKINNGHRGSYNLYVVPGQSVEIHTHRADGELVDVRVFRPGDIAEYDSFNLAYTAKITGITAKNVIFDVRGKTKRLKMDSFAWRNHNFDAVETANQNAIISMSI
jgi:hypothetical protein